MSNPTDQPCTICGRDNRHRTHDALTETGHLKHYYEPAGCPWCPTDCKSCPGNRADCECYSHQPDNDDGRWLMNRDGYTNNG